MDDATVDVDVRDNQENGRYEVTVRDMTATLDYRSESRLVLAHTHVPQSLDEPGHHLAGQLLRAAIARARADHLTLVPSCSFSRRWLRDNPEASIGVAIEWSGGANSRSSQAAPHADLTLCEPPSTKRSIELEAHVSGGRPK